MMTEEAKNAMTVLSGQILLVQLKGDRVASERFRAKYLTHITNSFGLTLMEDVVRETTDASGRFAALLANRYGVECEAAESLIASVSKAASAWLTGENLGNAEDTLRRIDAWIGFASVTDNKVPCPLSIVDETIEILMPIVCAAEVRAVIESVWSLGTSATETLDDVDVALEVCVGRLVGGVELACRTKNELKLIVLLHLPKEDERLAAYAGMIYGSLKSEYAQEEVA